MIESLTNKVKEFSEWLFAEIREGDADTDPKPDDKFNPLSAVLEFIQNALDALLKGKSKVFVKIYAKKLNAKEFHEKFLGGNFKKYYTYSDSIPNTFRLNDEDKIDCLVLEDKNTTGLCGDPSLYKKTLEDGRTLNDIHIFNNVFGKQSKLKDASKGGSEGEGRQTFCLASDIRTFFYFTKREDGSEYFMGIFYCGAFEAFGKEYSTFARFGNTVLPQDSKGREWSKPIGDQKQIDEFKKIFNITRDEPGTTIVIPYVKNSITLDECEKVILEGYRATILRNLIEIQIGEGNKNFNAENIEEKYVDLFSSDDVEKKAINGYFNFLRKTNKEKEIEFTQKITIDRRRPSSIDHIIDFTDVIEKYNSDKLIKFNVPLNFEHLEEGEKKSYLNIYLKKYPIEIDQGYKYCDTLRGYMPITKTREKTRNFFLTDIQEEEAMKLIKSAEVANHTELKSNHGKLDKYYGKVSHIITFINNAFLAIEQKLNTSNDDLDETTTLDLCAIEADTDMEREERVISGESEENEIEEKITSKWKLPDIPGKLKAYKAETFANGKAGWKAVGIKYTKEEIDEREKQAKEFISQAKKLLKEKPKGLKAKNERIIKADILSAENRIKEITEFRKINYSYYPIKIRIQAGFADGSRSPWNDYESPDFDFADTKTFKPTVKGPVNVSKIKNNRIELEVENENFEFKLTGFGSENEFQIKIHHIRDVNYNK